MSRFGPYSLIRRLSAGGMAEVFLAHREGPMGVGQIVALKRMLPYMASDPEFVAMFLDEARIASGLRHPNIVQLHDFGEIEGTYFLALEYVPGEDLRALLRRCGVLSARIPPAIVASIIAAVCEALHHAHELRDREDRPLSIVHRDVSPSNVLLSYDGEVKLADFGIARAERRLTSTTTRSPKGKYPYMSPEQARGKPIDRRSDLFSLAIVAHELLTGQRLFKADGDLETLRRITEDPIPTPTEIRPDVPAALGAIVMRGLERDPERRYGSAQEMHVELERYLLSLAVVGRRQLLAQYLRDCYGAEWVARHRRWAAGEDATDEPTRALKGTAPRPRRHRWPIAVVAAVAAIGAVGVVAWRLQVGVSRTDVPDAAVVRAERVQAPAVRDGGEPGPTRAPPEPQDAADPRDRDRKQLDWSYLTVDVGEPMEVRLDGRPLGRAPLLRRKVRPGRHKLTLRGEAGNLVTISLVTRAGEEHVERRVLGTGTFSCDVVPWAEVYVGRRKLGSTPLSVPLAEGSYSIRLSNPELHREKEIRVAVRPGEEVRIKTSFE